MRKINPISKTAANGSQNTSFEQKMGSTKPSVGQQPMKQSGFTKKSQFEAIQEHQMGKRPLAQTTKVSYNNSPNSRSKMGSMVGSIPPPGKQGSQKQQQIGQPIGDIPLISQYYSFKNKDGQKMPPNDILYQNDTMKKQSAQIAQSMLIRETKTNKRQNSGVPNNNSNQDAIKYHEQLKQKGIASNLSQERHMNQKMQQLTNGGKLKLKIMSESSSPNPNLVQGQLHGGNQLMNQYFMQNKHKFSQIDSPKDSSIERVRQFDIIGQESLVNHT
jgi:hypothetical protein